MPDNLDTAPRHDDGFRFDSETIDRGIAAVEFTRLQPAFVRRPWRGMAAAIFGLLGLGLALLAWPEEEPCLTWACQLECLSDEEMEMMMELLDDGSEDQGLFWGEESWGL